MLPTAPSPIPEVKNGANVGEASIVVCLKLKVMVQTLRGLD